MRGEPAPQLSSVTLKSVLKVVRAGKSNPEASLKRTPPKPGAMLASDLICAASPGFPPPTIIASPKSVLAAEAICVLENANKSEQATNVAAATENENVLDIIFYAYYV